MSHLNRREFLAATTTGAAALLTNPAFGAEWTTKIHKALIGAPVEATLEAWKAAGFEGYESTAHGALPETAEAARKLAENFSA